MEKFVLLIFLLLTLLIATGLWAFFAFVVTDRKRYAFYDAKTIEMGLRASLMVSVLLLAGLLIQ